MQNSPPQNIIKIIVIFSFLSISTFVFAQGISEPEAGNRGYIQSEAIPETKKGTVIFKESTSATSPKESEENLTVLEKQAREYRNNGLELQRLGNLAGAMSFYQKAIDLDPAYAVVHNDLGILYETNGDIQRAENSYLQAIRIDPKYSSAYSNLALLYENKRDLETAAFYWAKRADLGSWDDPWTQRAKKRLEDIQLVTGQKSIELSREQETVDFIKEVAAQKTLQKQDDKEQAKDYFQKAKLDYQKGQELAALRQAIDAKQLDPDNKDIDEFIDKVKLRLLSK